MSYRFGVVLAVLLAQASGASADKAKHPKVVAPVVEQAPAVDDEAVGSPQAPEDPLAGIPHLTGPRLVDLGNRIEIDLPDGMVLLEHAAAQDLLQKGGDDATGVVAVIARPGADWLVVLSYDGVGFVEDSDADELDAGELLETIRQGTVEQNAKRKALGVSELVVDGWSEPPLYNKSSHHLVWGLKAHSTSGPVINYFTRILGRHGYLAVNLIDAPATLDRSKLEAATILGATRFQAGVRYEDHTKGDRDSGIGLRGLVLGGVGLSVVAKGGFLVKLLLVLKKGFILVIAAFGGLFRWLTGRRKKTVELAAEPSTPSVPPANPSDDPPVGV